ncbi:nucleoside 2-deoxyribosyltransferase [Candidatus Woesearchaeota archaeon]|nr:nucleoside 2-deoxyribosyltransferase [Candidatus Woesearchaeota archaeon]
MKIYLAYKFKNSDKEELRKKIEETSKELEEQGHEVFAFFRDEQNYGEIKMTVQEVVFTAMKRLRECDAIYVIGESKGAYFEAGYAYALGKKVFYEGDSEFLKSVSYKFGLEERKIKRM